MTTTSRHNQTASWIGIALLGMVTLTGCGEEASASNESEAGMTVSAARASSTTTSSTKDVTSTRKTKPAPAPTPSVEIRFAAARVNPAWATSFVLFDTAQIEIAVDLKDFASGTHSLRMDITDSSGYLYASVSDNFDPSNTSTCDEMVDGACRIWQTLQVRGTVIEMYDMTGTWTVAQTVDSASTPQKTATFSLD